MRLLLTRIIPPQQSPRASEGDDWLDQEIASLRDLIAGEEASRPDPSLPVDASSWRGGSHGSRTRSLGRRMQRRGLAHGLSRARRYARRRGSDVFFYGFVLGLALILGWLAAVLGNGP
jgi:hypothetical protein